MSVDNQSGHIKVKPGSGGRRVVRVITAMLLLLLVGCSKPDLMPTPIIFVDGEADPFTTAPEPDRTTTGKVLIVTNRGSDGKVDAKSYYNNQRDRGLRVAVAEVDLGIGMTWQELRETSLAEKRRKKPKMDLIDLVERGTIWDTVPPLHAGGAVDAEVTDRFLAELNMELEQSHSRNIYIYIHGFNTKFVRNTEIAAQLHHYLGTDGVFLSYAWPSKGSVFAYTRDKGNAVYSTRYFRQFLELLADRTEDTQIHILAHSAGAPIAVGAVNDLSLLNSEKNAEDIRARYRIANLVLVAPDMDLAQFVNAWHDRVVDVVGNLTLYISTDDKALSFSSWIFGFARLGEPMEALSPKGIETIRHAKNFQMIDVAAAEKEHGSFLGHSYFHKDPWVSSDLMMLLRHRASPAERGLTQADGSPIWGFPSDYPDRAHAAAAKLYGTGQDDTGQE